MGGSLSQGDGGRRKEGATMFGEQRVLRRYPTNKVDLLLIDKSSTSHTHLDLSGEFLAGLLYG